MKQQKDVFTEIWGMMNDLFWPFTHYVSFWPYSYWPSQTLKPQPEPEEADESPMEPPATPAESLTTPDQPEQAACDDTAEVAATPEALPAAPSKPVTAGDASAEADRLKDRMPESVRPSEPLFEPAHESASEPASEPAPEPVSTTGDAAVVPPLTLAPVPAEPPPVVPEPLTEQGRKCLADIRKFASWTGSDGERNLKTLLELFESEYPGYSKEVEEALTQGREDGKYLEECYQLGRQDASIKALKKLTRRQGVRMDTTLKGLGHKSFQKGLNARKRKESENQLRQKGFQLSSVRPRAQPAQPTATPQQALAARRHIAAPATASLHPNDIRALSPAPVWQLLIDETGAVFDESADASKQQGRFVGLLVPATEPGQPPVLSPLPARWHAVDQDIDGIDRVFQAVLDAPVGVLGIEVRSLPVTPGERWLDGIALLVDWSLRLLNIDGLTRIEVLIEQRGIFEAGHSLEVVRRDCLRRHALVYPQRAAKIDLELRLIRKLESALNGYVDALAFTWAQTTGSSRARLKQSRLEDACLLSSVGGITARSMLHAWDAFAQGVHLPPDLWWDMLATPEARNPAALMATLLQRIGEEAQTSPPLWEIFLTEVKARMAATPVALNRLAGAVDWLQQHQPPAAVILPTLRLIWLTVQLAHINHLGATETAWLAELEHLEQQLFDENAPLVCHAQLHRAVAATNRFDFAAARHILEGWQEHPPAVPGLRYRAQVESSMGQHAAFGGDQITAARRFKRAMDGFARLSDVQEARHNNTQTGCYLAIALMDDETIDDFQVREALSRVTGALPEAAARLATGNHPAERYNHHLLLRWLTHRGDEATQQVYLANRAEWKTATGHPWPLIQLYRGLLLHAGDTVEARRLALEGAHLAFAANQGPTVRLIGTCCRCVASLWGEPWPEAEVELNNLTEAIPLAAPRIEHLRQALSHPNDAPSPLDLLAAVLPFNFR